MFRAAGRVGLVVGTLVCLAASVSAQQTTAATDTKMFEIIAVEGNQLVVRLPEGTREMTVPDDFRFNIDGQQMSVRELKPGMKGTATITTKTTVTPVTVTEVKNGTVMQVSGASIVVRTDEGVKMFTQGDIDKRGVKILRAGKAATIADFNTGDRLTATIITTKPPRVVTEREVQATLARAEAAAPAPPAAPAAAPASSQPPPSAAAESAGAAERTSPSAPSELPKTASLLPLVGLTGLVSVATAAGLTFRRRRQSR